MGEPLAVPPALSTSAEHIFKDDKIQAMDEAIPHTPDERLHVSYEISRTIDEIRKGRWKRVALQFPDQLLPNAPRVAAALREGLKIRKRQTDAATGDHERISNPDLKEKDDEEEARPYILGDTSYGACCVDEIAAEHINADVVVHYGRACLSPTARLPVIYVFVKQDLDLEATAKALGKQYPDKQQKIILMADVAYASHLPNLVRMLEAQGYTNLYATDIKHDPSSSIPNRSLPPDVASNPSNLADWSLFHIASPPSSLLLLLASQVSDMYIYEPSSSSVSSRLQPPISTMSVAMRRRYALVLRASTAPIIGILLNTLSHKSLLPTLAAIQEQIRAAGKKSYTFVVGKINPAKLANFAEIEVWVIVGCWESELVEGDGFWKPMITPWELSIALQDENERTWGQWESSWRKNWTYEGDVKSQSDQMDNLRSAQGLGTSKEQTHEEITDAGPSGDYDSEPESAPPDFDLRTGRYVSQSRPLALRSNPGTFGTRPDSASSSLMKRCTKTDLVSIGGEASPGAQFLNEKRTWRGLGSDLQIAYDTGENSQGTVIEEGRSGVARGYMNPRASMKT